MTTSKELMKQVFAGQIPERMPFVPSIFEHTAALLKVTPSRAAKSYEHIVCGQLLAHELYGHDLVSVGFDVYNVEAEALGAEVAYFEDNTLPTVLGAIVSCESDVNELKVPNPRKAGRMGMFLEACREIDAKIGKNVPVGGCVVGPFTLAAILRGFDDFLCDIMLEDPIFDKLMDFTFEVSYNYALEFVKAGLSVAINESWIAPPLLSPELFYNKVLPYEKRLIGKLKENGAASVSLICGGDTTLIAPHLVKTGTSLLMADYACDRTLYKKLSMENNVALRASIDAAMVKSGDADEMERAARAVISDCHAEGRFVFGCGIVSFDTNSANVLKLKEIANKLDPYK